MRRLPSTLRLVLAAIGEWARVALTELSAAATMVPPFSWREFAAIPIPFASLSLCCTVYRKFRNRGPEFAVV